MRPTSKFEKELREGAEYQAALRLLTEQHPQALEHIFMACAYLEAMQQVTSAYLQDNHVGFTAMHVFFHSLEIPVHPDFERLKDESGEYVYPLTCTDPNSPQCGLILCERFMVWMRSNLFWPALEKHIHQLEKMNPAHANNLREAMTLIRHETNEDVPCVDSPSIVQKHIENQDAKFLKELRITFADDQRADDSEKKTFIN